MKYINLDFNLTIYHVRLKYRSFYGQANLWGGVINKEQKTSKVALVLDFSTKVSFVLKSLVSDVLLWLLKVH